MYHLLVRDNAMRWPDLGTSPHWELAREIRLAGRFDGKIGGAATAATEHGLALTNTIADWTDSVAGYGVRVEPEQLVFVGTYFHAILRFSEACGDALAALYMLLSLTQSRTLLASVGFFDPEDFESTVNQIGGMRTTDQVRLA